MVAIQHAIYISAVKVAGYFYSNCMHGAGIITYIAMDLVLGS